MRLVAGTRTVQGTMLHTNSCDQIRCQQQRRKEGWLKDNHFLFPIGRLEDNETNHKNDPLTPCRKGRQYNNVYLSKSLKFPNTGCHDGLPAVTDSTLRQHPAFLSCQTLACLPHITQCFTSIITYRQIQLHCYHNQCLNCIPTLCDNFLQ